MSGGEADRNALFRKAAYNHLSRRFPQIDESLHERLKEVLRQKHTEMNSELIACLKKHEDDPEGSQACVANADRSFMSKLKQQIGAHKAELQACLQRTYHSFASNKDMQPEAGEQQLLLCIDAFESRLAGKLY